MSIIIDGVLEDVSNDEFSFNGKYKVPKNVRKIGDECFMRCYSLKKIDIPNSVVEIGERAFAHTHTLEEITFPKSVINFGKLVFSESALKRVVILGNIDEISNRMFVSCTYLKDVTIPGSIKNIGVFAFFACSSLTDIKNKDSKNGEEMKNVEIIGDYSFSGCKSLKMLHFYDIKSIGENAFNDCHNLYLYIDTSLFYIDFSNFYKTFDVHRLVLYNNKINYDNVTKDIRNIRKKELLDKVQECLSYDRLVQKIEDIKEHPTLLAILDKICDNLETIKVYDYRIDFDKYVKSFIKNYAGGENLESSFLLNNIQNANLINPSATQSLNNNFNVSNKVEKEMDNDKTKPSRIALKTEEIPSIYKDIPYSLYEYGKKLNLLDTIKEIKNRIDTYLKNNNITNKNYFLYNKHEGFIREMLDCIHNDSNYNYMVALNNYMKYMTNTDSKDKPKNIEIRFDEKPDDTLSKEDEILKLKEEIERLKRQISSYDNKENKDEKIKPIVSLEKPKIK